MTTVDRLSFPRGQEREVEACYSAIPPHPLPTWTSLPLDAKLPLIPGPSGTVVLFTTDLGEKIHKSSRDLDFDLTDPNAMVMSNNYKPLHDPHLKPHLTAPQMKTRLTKGGFITPDGKVICTLKEFNEYRQYLRKINLALIRRKKELEQRRRRRRESGRSDSIWQMREEKVKEIRKKLAQKHEEDRQRYIRLMAEVEERRSRVREEHLSRLSERERQQHAKQQEKLALVKRKQKQEQQQKLALLRKWVEEDKRRAQIAEMRRRHKQQQRQRRSEECWLERKRLQHARMEEDKRQRALAEELKRKRIECREAILRKQRERHEATFLKLTNQQRAEKEKAEEEHRRRFQERVQRCRAMSARRRSIRKYRRKKPSRPRVPLKSNWDLEQALLQTLSGDTGLGPGFSDGEGPMRGYLRRPSDTRSLEDLGLGDYRGAAVKEDEPMPESDDFAERSLAIGTEPPYIRDLMDVMFDKESTDYTMDDAAQAMVALTTYISSEVLCPAIEHYHNELFDRPVTPTPYTDEEYYDRHLPSGQSLRGEELGEWYTDADDKIKKASRSVQFNCDPQMISFENYDWVFSDSGSSDADWDYRAEDGDDEDEGFDVDSFGALLDGKDSFSRTEEKSIVSKLVDLLKMLLQKLNKGTISTEKAQKLMELTTEIMGIEPKKEESDVNSESDSFTSLLAAQVVQETIAKVQKELLPAKMGDQQKEFLDKASEVTSITDLSTLIVEQVLITAIRSVFGIGFEQPSDKVPLEQAVVDKGSKTSLGIGISVTSSTASIFIDDMVHRLAEEINKNVVIQFPIARVQSDSSVGSSVESLVNDVLDKVISELKGSTEKSLFGKKKQESHSSTSVLIDSTLDRVVKELEGEIQQTRSSTSVYINQMLENAVKDLSKEQKKPGFLSWGKSKKLSPATSKTSLTSLFVKEIIGRVANDIQEEQNDSTSQLKTESSIFIEQLIDTTIIDCVEKIRTDLIPKENLTKLASAIVSSHKGLEGTVSLPTTVPGLASSSQTKTKEEMPRQTSNIVITPATSALVDTLIRETLVKVQQQLKDGGFSNEEIISLAAEMNARDLFPLKSSNVLITDSASSASATAECYVQEAVNRVLDDIGLTGHRLLTPEIPHESETLLSAECRSIEDMVDSVLTGVFHEMLDGTTTCSETDVRKLNFIVTASQEILFSPERGSLPEVDVMCTDENEKQESRVIRDLTSNDYCSDEPESLHPATDDTGLPVDDPKEGDELNDFGKIQNGVAVDYSTIKNASEQDEEEVVVVPMMGDTPMDIEPDLVDYALGAISHKHPEDLEDPQEPSERYSFRDLVHPDVSSMPSDTINFDPESSLRDEMIKVSSMKFGQTQSIRRLSLGPKPSPLVLKAISNANALNRSTVIKPTTNDEDKVESTTVDSTQEDENEVEEENINQISDFHTKEELDSTTEESAARASTISLAPVPPTATKISQKESNASKPSQRRSSTDGFLSSKSPGNRRSSTGGMCGCVTKTSKGSTNTSKTSIMSKTSSDSSKCGSKKSKPVSVTYSAPKVLHSKTSTSKQPDVSVKTASHATFFGNKGSAYKSNPRLVKVESAGSCKGPMPMKSGSNEMGTKGRKSPNKISRNIRNKSSSEATSPFQQQFEPKKSSLESDSSSSIEVKSICGSHSSVVHVRSGSRAESNPEEPELAGLKQSPSPPLNEEFDTKDSKEDGRASSEAKPIEDEEIVVKPTRRVVTKTSVTASTGSKGNASGSQNGAAGTVSNPPIRYKSRVEALRASETGSDSSSQSGTQVNQDPTQTIEMVAKPQKKSTPSKTPSAQSEKVQSDKDNSVKAVSAVRSDTVPHTAMCHSTGCLGRLPAGNNSVPGDSESPAASNIDSGSSVDLALKASISHLSSVGAEGRHDVVYTHSDSEQHEETLEASTTSDNPASSEAIKSLGTTNNASNYIQATASSHRKTGSGIQTTIPERPSKAEDPEKTADDK